MSWSIFSADEIAQVIVEGVQRKREEILFGRDSKIYNFASRFLPRSLIKAVARRELRKLDLQPSEIKEQSGVSY